MARVTFRSISVMYNGTHVGILMEKDSTPLTDETPASSCIDKPSSCSSQLKLGTDSFSPLILPSDQIHKEEVQTGPKKYLS